MFKLLVLYPAHSEDLAILEHILGMNVKIYLKEDLEQELLKEILPQIEILLVGSGRRITRNLIKNARNLKMIQTLAAGVDLIPWNIIPKDVIVCSNAGGNARAVAEHALALLLSAIKKITYHTEKMRSGIWKRTQENKMFSDKIVGIIGFGHIGKEIAKLLKPLGFKVYGINRRGKTDIKIDFIGSVQDLDSVLRLSDVIIIALPLTKRTRGLIDKEKLELMKKDAILINISRGPVIVEKDLFDHLKNNPTFIAALDVWWKYPERKDSICYQNYPFHTLENIIMTPHIAGFSSEIRKYVIEHAAENIARFVKGQKPINIVDRRLYL